MILQIYSSDPGTTLKYLMWPSNTCLGTNISTLPFSKIKLLFQRCSHAHSWSYHCVTRSTRVFARSLSFPFQIGGKLLLLLPCVLNLPPPFHFHSPHLSLYSYFSSSWLTLLLTTLHLPLSPPLRAVSMTHITPCSSLLRNIWWLRSAYTRVQLSSQPPSSTLHSEPIPGHSSISRPFTSCVYVLLYAASFLCHAFSFPCHFRNSTCFQCPVKYYFLYEAFTDSYYKTPRQWLPPLRLPGPLYLYSPITSLMLYLVVSCVYILH